MTTFIVTVSDDESDKLEFVIFRSLILALSNRPVVVGKLPPSAKDWVPTSVNPFDSLSRPALSKGSMYVSSLSARPYPGCPGRLPG